MSNDYKFTIGEPKPFTKEDFDRALEWVFRPRPPRPPPQTTFDFVLAAKHRIRYAWEGDTILMPASEMKRAKRLGVVKPYVSKQQREKTK